MNWGGPFYLKNEKKSRNAKKTEKGDPLGPFNFQFVGKYQKIEGPFGGNFVFRKKSHRTENTLKEYLAPLSYLDDVKILSKLLKK